MAKKKAKSAASRRSTGRRYTERELRDELRRARGLAFIHVIGQVSKPLITALGWSGVAWAMAWAWVNTPEHLSGKETTVSLLTAVTTPLSKQPVNWAIIGLLLLAWMMERKGRKSDVERLSSSKTELEKQLDPKRSSSGMNPDGSSPEE